MIKFFAQHPTAANLVMVISLLLGVLCFSSLRREDIPKFTSETLEISAQYPGATPEEMEESVILPIEEALNKVSGIKSIRATAREGEVAVLIEMADGVDYQSFYNDIRVEVDAVDTFPEELENLIIKPFYNNPDEVVCIAVYGELAPRDLKAYCEQLKRKITQGCDGLTVEITGFGQREIRVELYPDILVAYRLSVADVARLIREQSRNQPSGVLETGQQDIALRFDSRVRSATALGVLTVLATPSGGELRLEDIGTITDCFDSNAAQIWYNDYPAALISIMKSKNADSLTVYAEIMRLYREEIAGMPKSVHFDIVRDSAKEVDERLNMIFDNAWQGVVLVFLTLWLFMNLRFSFWVVMGLPVSFLGAFFVMYIMNISLNMISTYALLIAIGILMDDSIVIAENIARHLKNGESPPEAAIKGTREVGISVLSSFATTVCVFAPLMFLTGEIGKILQVIPLTLIIVLSISLVEALLVLPRHLSHGANDGRRSPGRLRNRIDGLLNRLCAAIAERGVNRVLRYRYMGVAAIIGLFVFTVALLPSGYLPFEVFPDEEVNTAYCKVEMPPGTSLEKCKLLARDLCLAAERVNSTLKDNQPGNADLVKSAMVRFSSDQDGKRIGPHLFTVTLELLDVSIRRNSIDEVIDLWLHEVPRVPGALEVSFSSLVNNPGGKAVEIRLRGDSLAQLKQASNDLQSKLAEYDGVKEIGDDMAPGKPEMVMKLKPGALSLGLTAEGVAGQLKAAYQGEKADELHIGLENYGINVRLANNLENSRRYFDDFLLRTPAGNMVALTTVGELVPGHGFSVITRYNRKRTVTVSADVITQEANAQMIIDQLTAGFLPDLTDKYPGISYEIGGELEAGDETGSSMLKAFLVGLFGIFAILSLQYRNYWIPLVVMGAIPLALTGALWGHWLWGLPFSFMSILGVISLSGIVVNDSILLLDRARQNEATGQTAADAMCRAAQERFRPLLLTNLTTIAGLLPLLLERSVQAQTLIPLALSIICGLGMAMTLTLFFIPSLFMIFTDFRHWASKGLNS